MQVSQGHAAPKPKTTALWLQDECLGRAFVFSIGPGPYSGTAHVCAFDLTKPDRTTIDWRLVRARPDPENPFSYPVIEVLRGDQETYRPPCLVTSVNRRMLNNNPDHSVLFRKTPRAGWALVTYVDNAFASLLALTLDTVGIWGGPDYHPSRFATFKALRTSTDPKLRELAVGELDKAL